MTNNLRGLPRLETRARPKGSLVVTDRMRAAARDVREGMGRGECARLYGVGRATINDWILRVTESEREARLQKGARP